MRRRVVGLVTLVVLVGVGVGGCGSSSTAPAAAKDVSRVDPGLRRAVAYLRVQRSSIDVPSLLIFDYMARRWGVGGLADFRGYAKSVPGATSPSNAFVRLFGARWHASGRALERVRDTDTLTATALECRRAPLRAPYPQRLRAALRAGGYQATHVLLAIRWAGDLACPIDGAARIRRQAIGRVAAELRRADAVTDESLEQAVVLAESGAAGRIRTDWPRRVRAAQRSDGGWAEDPGGVPRGDYDPTRSNFHATGLALWYLLAVGAPGSASTPMVPD